MKRIQAPPLTRILRRVIIDPATSCWHFSGCRDRSGYGRVRWQGKTWRAYRLMYELIYGIPDPKHDIHHTCETHDCVNPLHLRSITHREHMVELTPRGLGYTESRKTHCPQGHPLVPGNLVPSNAKLGWRCCLTCNLAHSARTNARISAERKARRAAAT